jgi:ketosteroid isomerase-like protein
LAATSYSNQENKMKDPLPAGLLCLAAVLSYSSAGAAEEADRRAVAALDIEFQAAVKNNNADVMARLLHKDMVLVLGNGSVGSRDEQLREAREKLILYEIQDEEPGTQAVRVSGDTAIVTARLRIKGIRDGKTFDRDVWFSDTYIRTPAGWQYFFGQASLPLPELEK